jgi:hypothetical protein
LASTCSKPIYGSFLSVAFWILPEVSKHEGEIQGRRPNSTNSTNSTTVHPDTEVALSSSLTREPRLTTSGPILPIPIHRRNPRLD